MIDVCYEIADPFCSADGAELSVKLKLNHLFMGEYPLKASRS